MSNSVESCGNSPAALSTRRHALGLLILTTPALLYLPLAVIGVIAMPVGVLMGDWQGVSDLKFHIAASMLYLTGMWVWIGYTWILRRKPIHPAAVRRIWLQSVAINICWTIYYGIWWAVAEPRLYSSEALPWKLQTLWPLIALAVSLHALARMGGQRPLTEFVQGARAASDKAVDFLRKRG